MKQKRIWSAVLIFLIVVMPSFFIIAAQEPMAEKGVLDVSTWDFEKEGPLGMDGQWEFYWKQLFQPPDFADEKMPTMTGYIDTPGYWDGYQIGGEGLTGMGYATFRLVVRNLPEDQLIAFDLPLMHTAYKLWANGDLLSSNGTLGITRETSQPQYLPKTPILKGPVTDLELVLQISNFHHNNGGIWQTLKIGLADDIVSALQMRTAFDLFLLGAILIMALYHFALFALRQKEGSTLFFGTFCLIISFRISIHGVTIFSVLFPDVSWEALVTLDYFTLYFGLPFYCAFIYSLYPVEFSRKVLHGIWFISLAFVAFSILVPARIFTAYLTPFQIIIGVACLYTIYILIRALINKKDGAGVVLGGCFILIVTFVNDALYNSEVIHTADLIGFGLFIMIFSQSYVLSSKFSKAFDLVEELSIDLDYKVKERTAAIKDLLDTTGQGFFSFAGDYKVQPFTSRATSDFFGKPIEDEDALALLFPDKADEKKKLLNLVFEDSSNLDLIEDILPSEVVKEGRIYTVDYHWIKSRKEVGGRMMVVMTDMTTQRTLENQLRIDEEKNKMIVKIAVDRHGFIDFLNEVNRCLDHVEDQLSKPVPEVMADELFRHFHTIKGGMASYHFTKVAEKAHDIETILDSVRTDSALPTEDMLTLVKKETTQLKEILKETLNDLDQIIPKQLIEAGFQPYFRIAETKINELESVLRKEIKVMPAVAKVVKNLRKQPIRNIMKKFAADAELMAVSLGKKVKIRLEGEETEIIHNSYKPMMNSLIHIIRNCVDHGIERPEIRLKANKPGTGNLAITAESDETNLKITIFDDGAGIDAAIIKAKALEKGLINISQAQSMSDSDAIKLIFSPGFSTNETVTELSGRGVGMDAVASEVAALKGTIDVRTTPGVGSRFVIKVPSV